MPFGNLKAHMTIKANELPHYQAFLKDIEQNPNVRLRAETSIFELEAVKVNGAQEFESFAQAWEAKYGNRPRNEDVDKTYLYRLRSRTN